MHTSLAVPQGGEVYVQWRPLGRGIEPVEAAGVGVSRLQLPRRRWP